MMTASIDIEHMQRLPKPEVAILVPVYKNAETLIELARRISGSLAAFYPNFQIIFVVDASPDDSWRIVKQLAEQDLRICGILLKHNQGQHRALMVAMQQTQASWIAIIDADLQDPPELLPELINECARTQQTVFARRIGQYQSAGKMLTSRLFKWLLGKLIDTPPNVGSYLVIPAPIAEKIRYADVRNVSLVVMARVFSPAWTAINYTRLIRNQGTSAYTPWGRLRSAVRGFICVFECQAWLRSNSKPTHGNKLKENSMIMERINI
jgi:glycosyltransferase involved in cell wall biosynthesis